MSVEKTRERCISEILAELDNRLGAHGFAGPPETVLAGERKFIQWKRELRWRVCIVRLTLSARKPELPALQLALQVRLCCGGLEEPLLLDQVEVDAFAGHPGGYRLPYLPDLLGFSCRRMIRRMVRDLEVALGWFAEYESPESCLEKLNSGATMYGPARGALYRELTSFLERLV